MNKEKGETLSDGTWVSNTNWRFRSPKSVVGQPVVNNLRRGQSSFTTRCYLCGFCSCIPCDEVDGAACDLKKNIYHDVGCPYSRVHPANCRGLDSTQSLIKAGKKICFKCEQLVRDYKIAQDKILKGGLE